MSLVKKSITITDKQAAWVKSQIAAGDFGNDSEVFRDLIRREQARQTHIENIQQALIEGERSGVSDRTPEKIMAAAKNRLRADGTI